MGFRSVWRAIWSRPYSEKASVVAGLIGSGQEGRTLSPTDNPAKFADEAYVKNVIAFRSIDEVARSAASVPWILFDKTTEREVDDHPILDLLAKPNPVQAHSEFTEAITAFYQIAGNSYIEAVGPDNGPPIELWTKRPDRMRVVAGNMGVPQAFEFKKSGGVFRWPVDQTDGSSLILHLKRFHPLDDWYGMSPISPAAMEIDTHNFSRKWNKKLLENEARPSGALQMKVMKTNSGDLVANLSDSQRLDLTDQLERKFAGWENAGTPMVLEGGLEWKQISLSPRDMDFINARNTTARDIAQAFGVPPVLLGIQGDSTFNNQREARLALWEQTILPFLFHLMDEYNGWLVPMFGDDSLVLKPNLNDISALTLQRERRFETAENASFMTLNEKRKSVGLEAIEGGDIILIPATMIPLGDASGAEDDNAEAGRVLSLPEGGVDPDEARRLLHLAYDGD